MKDHSPHFAKAIGRSFDCQWPAGCRCNELKLFEPIARSNRNPPVSVRSNIIISWTNFIAETPFKYPTNYYYYYFNSKPLSIVHSIACDSAKYSELNQSLCNYFSFQTDKLGRAVAAINSDARSDWCRLYRRCGCRSSSRRRRPTTAASWCPRHGRSSFWRRRRPYVQCPQEEQSRHDGNVETQLKSSRMHASCSRSSPPWNELEWTTQTTELWGDQRMATSPTRFRLRTN